MNISTHCLYAAFGVNVQRQGAFTVRKPLSGVLDAFTASQKSNQQFRVLFADASVNSSILISWSVVREVRIVDGSTTVTFFPSVALTKKVRAKTLIKARNGEAISRDIRRGQIVCITPTFLNDLVWPDEPSVDQSDDVGDRFRRSNFVAYHNPQRMGEELDESSAIYRFFSKKPKRVLEESVGNTVWVFTSTEGEHRSKRFFFVGAYVPVDVKPHSDGWHVSGPSARTERLDVTGEPWFRELLREQANFSRGFSPLKSKVAISALTEVGSCGEMLKVFLDDAEEQCIRRRKDITATEKERLVKTRLGQGTFRNSLRDVERGCRLTRVTHDRHLRASHIKPWCKSSDEEKLDGHNGLLLAPHFDHLFDRGYISFADAGDLLISSTLDPAVLTAWKISLPLNVGAFSARQCKYLAYHRMHVFRGQRENSGAERGGLENLHTKVRSVR